MVNAIFMGIYNLIVTIIDAVLMPINLLVQHIFPDMSESIAQFTNFVNTYLGSTLSYFFSILPPIFRSTLVIWFTFVIAYYGVYFAYNMIIKIFEIVKNIKFW